jgi:nitrate reductase gamma subunit
MKTDFLFGIFPYIAFGLLAAGIVVRYLLVRRQSATVPQEVSQAMAVFGNGWLWKISVLFLAVGHLISLAAPQAILTWNASLGRLYLLEGISFAVGIAALAGWLVLMWRNLGRHGGSAIAELSDTVLLALLFVGILSGLLMAVLYRWGSSWGAMILTPYILSFLRGNPAPRFMLQMHPFLVRLHVFSLFAAVAVVPATRLGSVIISILQTLASLAAKPVSATGRAAVAWLRKHNPAPLFWPEED